MYNLYHSKKECKLKISKVGKVKLQGNYTEEPTVFNDCYYICANRKPLKDLAVKIKEQWLLEAQERVQEIENLKV